MRRQHNSLHNTEIFLLAGGFLFLLFYFCDMQQVLVSMQMPLFFYQDGEVCGGKALYTELVECMIPLSGYLKEQTEDVLAIQDYDTQQLILSMQEAKLMQQEEEELVKGLLATEDGEKTETGLEEEKVKTVSGNGQENGEKIEHETAKEDAIAEAKEKESKDSESLDSEQACGESDGKMVNIMQDEIYHENPQINLSMEQYQEYEQLLSDFYVVDKSTYIDESQLNLNSLQNVSMSLDKAQGGPQILIYHTHSQEGYLASQDGGSYTVVDAGNELTSLLTERYGYQVLHDTGVYDTVRDYAYAKAAPALEQILQEHPSIQVIIDLHRDGVAQETHLVTDIDGRQAAQIMLFNGLSCTKKIGEIEYLANENRGGNLAFSFQLERKLKEYYPGLSRKIYLKGYRYNMQYRARSLLVELGAQNNTEIEVRNALGPLAHCIDLVLSGA